MTTRRSFLTTSSLAAVAALGTPWRLHAAEWARLGLSGAPLWQGRRGDPDLKALAHRALETATAAGASYAEVYFTLTRRMHVGRVFGDRPFEKKIDSPHYDADIGVSVRALVQGAWGFAAWDNDLSPDMMDWLARKAVLYGQVSAWSTQRPIELGERPPVAVGHWEMPVKRDPFSVPWAEHKEILGAMIDTAASRKAVLTWSLNFERQERTFASTDGAFTTQTVYNTFGANPAMRVNNPRIGESVFAVGEESKRKMYGVPWVSPMGVGLEAYDTIVTRLPEWLEQTKYTKFSRFLESPGNLEVVFDASVMAMLVNQLGVALEMDRALGREVNTLNGSTSFLSPVEKMLGTHAFAAGITLTGNRTHAGGAATVQWDTEGVAAQEFPLITDGRLIDYATTREFVPELAAGYRTRGQAVQSRGCAGTESALTVPMVQTPNLELHPGPKDLSLEDLMVGIDRGIAFLGGKIKVEPDQLTAHGQAWRCQRIKKGKLVDEMVHNIAYDVLFSEFWKNLVALGGERSAETRGFTVEKGEPRQLTAHSVRAVAGRFKNVHVRVDDDDSAWSE